MPTVRSCTPTEINNEAWADALCHKPGKKLISSSTRQRKGNILLFLPFSRPSYCFNSFFIRRAQLKSFIKKAFFLCLFEVEHKKLNGAEDVISSKYYPSFN